MSIQQVAEYVGLSYEAVRLLVVRGDIPNVRPPSCLSRGEASRRRLLDRADVDAWIESLKERSGQT
jgi:excisionase family DNA binding protein